MSKKMMNIVIVSVTIIILIIAVIFLKPSLKENIHFELPFAAMSDLAIRDLTTEDYSDDEESIKLFLTDFFNFITEEYEYTSDAKSPIKEKYNSYFTQKAENARDNYEYKSDFLKDDDATFTRALFTDIIQIIGMKIEGAADVKVISKKNQKLKYVNEDGSIYNILYAVDISRNKKVSENGVYLNYGGERILSKYYVEVELYEYLGEFKIHNLTRRSTAEEIKAFQEYFKSEQNVELYSFDEMISKIKYSKENQDVKKYINKDTESINTKAISEFDENDIRRVVKNNIDEVVVINNLDSNGKINSIGSGFFIKPGIVLTNWHVIEGAYELKLITYDGIECKIDGIISANDKVDLAILKLEKEIGQGVTFASLESLTNSSPVVAIGHPLGNLYTITAGTYDKKVVVQDASFIQSQLPLLPGNSGGPLLDKNGNVIGINTAIAAGDTTLSLTYKYIDNILEALEKYKFSEIEVYKY